MIQNIFMLSKIEILFNISKFKWNKSTRCLWHILKVVEPRAGSNVLTYDGNDGQDGLWYARETMEKMSEPGFVGLKDWQDLVAGKPEFWKPEFR